MNGFRRMVEQLAQTAAVEAAPFNCEHPNTEVRARTIRGGSRQFVRQCVDCGEPIGSPLKQFGTVPPFDENLLRNGNEERAKRREAARLAESQSWWTFYHEYTRSPEWHEMREKVLRRDKYVCQGCLVAKATQVHHQTYEHFGAEFAFELISLCKPCHERYHGDDEVEATA